MTGFNLAITLGLAAAALWGAGDLVARFATRAIGPYRTFYRQQAIGLVLLSAGLLATYGFARCAGQPWRVWFWATVVGILFSGGTLLLYIMFERGKLVALSPNLEANTPTPGQLAARTRCPSRPAAFG